MIEFSRPAYDAMVHRASGLEREVCGVLGGEYGAEWTTVVDAYPAENAANAPETRYRIDPEEQLEIFEAIEDAGLEVAGFYHSHPTGPTGPSETDVERATWPDYSDVIVALDGYPHVGSWRWREDRDAFEGELLRVLPAGECGWCSRR